MRWFLILLSGALLLGSLTVVYAEGDAAAVAGNIEAVHNSSSFDYTAIILVALLVVCGIAVSQAWRGKATFFKNYMDVGISYIPLLVIIWAFNSKNLTSENSSNISALSMLFAIVYNYVRAFTLNRRRIIMGFCVGTGRLIIGYLLPLLMTLFYFTGGISKNKGESQESFQGRRLKVQIIGLGLIGALFMLLKSLIRDNTSNEANVRGREVLKKWEKRESIVKHELYLQVAGYIVNKGCVTCDDLINDLGIERPVAVAILLRMTQEKYLTEQDAKGVRYPTEQLSVEYVENEAEDKGVLSDDRKKELKDALLTPSLKPTAADANIRAWIYRIEQWGNLTFEYYDPETKRKTKIDKESFLQMISDQSGVQSSGKLNVDELGINKIVIWRNVVTSSGRKDIEKFFVATDVSNLK